MEAQIATSKVVDGHIQQWAGSFPLLIFYEGIPVFQTDYDEDSKQVRIWPFRVILVSNTEANLETLMENFLTKLVAYTGANQYWTVNGAGSPWDKRTGFKGIEFTGQEEEQIGVASW